jgi:hypothetical protein
LRIPEHLSRIDVGHGEAPADQKTSALTQGSSRTAKGFLNAVIAASVSPGS